MSPSDAAWRLLKREIHPGSLAAYREMVEDLGDNMPVEQRLAQLLGEGKYLNHPRQFEPYPARTTKQYDYHGDVENLEDVPILNEKLEAFKITDDGYPVHRNLSIYDKHNLSPKRVTYSPELYEREELPTFAGIPLNEETGFTRSEPMDLAWRLLKEDDVRLNRDAVYNMLRTALENASEENRMTKEQHAEALSRRDRVREAKRQHLDNEIEMERAGGLEGWRRDVLREIEDNPYHFRSRGGRYSTGGGGQTRLPGFREHFITSARQRGNDGVGHPVALRPAIAVRDNKRNTFEGDERQRLELLPKRPKPRIQPARLRMNVDSENTTRDFFLEDEAGNVLSRIDDIERYKLPGKDVSLFDREDSYGQDRGRLKHYGGYSNIKRQGYYRDLLESILRHGFKITSDDRNNQSNPFHRKFLRTIPDDIRSFTEGDTKAPGKWDRIDYEGKAPFSRTKDLDYGDLVVETRSKYPITYDTPWVAHQKVLDAGVNANRDIIVPTHVDREGNIVEPKRYVQSRLAGMPPVKNRWGEEEEPFEGQETITTKEGIVVPKTFKSSYYAPHLQSGGALGVGRGDGRWGRKLVTQPQPSAQALMNFGIDPMTRMRQQIGVVDSPRIGTDWWGLNQATLGESSEDKLMSGRNLTTEELNQYRGQS